MPKTYLDSNNIEKSLLLIAKNIDNNFNLKKTEIAAYVGKLLKGIIDEKTVTGYMPKEFRKPYGILETCPICGKPKLKSLKRHMNISHYNLKELNKEAKKRGYKITNIKVESNPMSNTETVVRITK